MTAKPTAWVKAVNGVSLTVFKGESFGLVGESGCGKTTVGRLIMRLLEPTTGRIEFDGYDLTRLNRAGMRRFRRRMQMIFQDPYSSLDPRMKVAAIITEPLTATQKYSKAHRREIAIELLQKVGLQPADADKYPHEFSGGQRQRLGIARALCVGPELIIADEPVSALDVSIQAQIINLLMDLKQEFLLAYILISHDLGVVEHMCDRIAVMYLGQIVELAPRDLFVTASRHPYTQALLAAVPRPDPHAASRPLSMEGDVPSPIDLPAGCPFHPRCPGAEKHCRHDKPSLIEVEPEHHVACWMNRGRGV